MAQLWCGARRARVRLSSETPMIVHRRDEGFALTEEQAVDEFKWCLSRRLKEIILTNLRTLRGKPRINTADFENSGRQRFQEV